MDRREALALITVTAASAGVGAKVKVVPADDDIALLVLECPGFISAAMSHRLADQMDFALKGTPLEGTKCIVLMQGMKLKALTKKEVLDLASEDGADQ